MLVWLAWDTLMHSALAARRVAQHSRWFSVSNIVCRRDPLGITPLPTSVAPARIPGNIFVLRALPETVDSNGETWREFSGVTLKTRESVKCRDLCVARALQIGAPESVSRSNLCGKPQILEEFCV